MDSDIVLAFDVLFFLLLRVPILTMVQMENFPLLNIPTFTSLAVANHIVKSSG